jgi:hypothetical protein
MQADVPMHGWPGNLLNVERLAREKVVNEPGRVSQGTSPRRGRTGSSGAIRSLLTRRRISEDSCRATPRVVYDGLIGLPENVVERAGYLHDEAATADV